MEEHEHSKHENLGHKHLAHKGSKVKVSKVRIWQITAGILGVLLLLSLFVGGSKGGTGTVKGGLSAQKAADKAISYINTNLMQPGTSATVKSVEDTGSLYNLKMDIGGREFDSYVTKDGKLLFPNAVDLNEKVEVSAQQTQPPPANLEKSDKPEVELFVMSHCPYGTQMEKGILPVVKELGDKINFEVKFVNYAMHGKKELDEQLRQYCVQRDYNDKYITYLGKFLETENPDEALSAIGLSEADISQCVEETDKKYKVTELYEDPQKSEWSGRFPPFKVHDTENKKYGVRGSPTLVINGQTANSGRDAQSLLNTICGAFTDKPEECNTDMTKFGNPAPGFGFDTQGGSATTAGCG